MKAYLFYSISALAGIAALTFLGTLWFDLFTEATVWKILITCFVLAVLVGVVIAAKEHLLEEDRQRKDGFLN
jgi:biotin transporter BioY